MPSNTKLVPLAGAKKQRLAEAERKVESGMLAMSEGLREIRDEKLYLGTYATFEEYMEGRWSIALSHGYRLIEAGETIKTLREAGAETLPATEWVARPLTNVPDEQKPAAWKRAQDIAGEEGAKKPAARHVTAAVDEIQPPPENSPNRGKSTTPKLPGIEDHEYQQSLKRIGEICGRKLKTAIEAGTFPKVDSKAVILWSKQSDELLPKIEKLVAGGERWSVKESIQFLAEMPNGKHRIERLCWLAMAEEDGTWSGTINGVEFVLTHRRRK